MSDHPKASKGYCQPIEAAMRWGGLLEYEQEILPLVPTPGDSLPKFDYPQWSELRLYTECIYDAIFNRELSHGRNGITQHDETLWDSPELTVLHVDLKRWIRNFWAGLKSFSMCRAISIACTESGTMYGRMSVTLRRFFLVSILCCLSEATVMIHRPRSRSN